MNLSEYYDNQLYEVKDSSKPGVLATMKGPFFFPELPSRNGGRTYPKKAWENALANNYTKRLLESSLMLGTVGHKEMAFDELISEQKVSHVTRNLWIEENNGKYPNINSPYVGIGEADILDTPVGRILNTLIRADCKLGVSSKAYGEYKGKDAMGHQMVDENKFFCQRFDFVVDPGYLEAMPSLKEEYEKIFPTIKEDTSMDEKMQKLLEDKINAEHQLEDVLKSNKDQAKMLEEYKTLGAADSLKETIATLTASLKSYEEIGTVAEITETLEGSKVALAAYKEIGDVEEIMESLEATKELLGELKDIGTVDEIREALESTKELTDELDEIGSVDEIRETLEGAREMIEAYQVIGTVEEIQEAFEKIETVTNSLQESAVKKDTDELVATFGISSEKATKYLEKMSLEDAKDLLKDMQESVSVTNRYKAPLNEDKTKEPVNVLNESRTSRLYGQFSRKA
jgi:tetratricopeptide (TPR) repeat protein